ncbi:MAG: radical SAM protein [Deltaproteobacteria bacterium]|nr:radical SAM protein [Deltaproteobacteria bacterium]
MSLKIPMAGALGCGPDCGCGPEAADPAGSYDEILGSTRAWCPECQKTEPALYAANSRGVYMDRLCPSGGSRKNKVAETAKWFSERVGPGLELGPAVGLKPVTDGCPFDCGLCRAHLGRLRLPIFSVTNQCQLACPICFTHNRKDLTYHKTPGELEKILEVIEAQSETLDLLNITGGEPTLHPALPELLEQCARRSFDRISVNSNGLKLAEDEELVKKIKSTGAQVILSLDTLDPLTSIIVHGRDIVGAKLSALERLERLEVPTILLIVWMPGINDREIGLLIRRYFARTFIKGVTIQTVTYTGYHGSRFEPKKRATIEEVENGLSDANIRPTDFFAHGSYHALCYSVAYYLIDSAAMVPLTSLAEPEILTRATSFGYLMRPTDELSRSVRDKINSLWAAGASLEQLRLIKKLVSALFTAADGPGRDELQVQNNLRRAAESTGIIKTVCLHAHMDQDNFDLARVATCGDLVPEEDGSFRPACAYNLIYRCRDPRFWAEEGR